MRVVAAMVLCAACGGQPMLANAPQPDPGAVAGVAAAAAAAATLADPNAASRKPEKKVDDNKREVEVKEQVPASAFDHLDQGSASGSGTEVPVKKAVQPVAKHKGPPPKIPSPKEAAEHDEPTLAR